MKIILLLLALVPCISYALDDDLRLLIVDGAYDVQTYNLDKGIRTQINYKFDKVYPGFAISNAKFEDLTMKGWQVCSGLPEKWERYIDMSNDSPRGVHQYITYFAKENRLLTIAMRYYSAVTSNSICPKNPDNSIQNIILIDTKYDDRKKNERLLGIQCN